MDSYLCSEVWYAYRIPIYIYICICVSLSLYIYNYVYIHIDIATSLLVGAWEREVLASSSGVLVAA